MIGRLAHYLVNQWDDYVSLQCDRCPQWWVELEEGGQNLLHLVALATEHENQAH